MVNGSPFTQHSLLQITVIEKESGFVLGISDNNNNDNNNNNNDNRNNNNNVCSRVHEKRGNNNNNNDNNMNGEAIPKSFTSVGEQREKQNGAFTSVGER